MGIFIVLPFIFHLDNRLRHQKQVFHQKKLIAPAIGYYSILFKNLLLFPFQHNFLVLVKLGPCLLFP